MSTTLFTIAGMEQFVPVFLGDEPPPAPRAVTVQRCLRVAGAKSDIENVGRTGRHGTFLEMLGNFSFGDYYKREAIGFAWDLATNVWKLDAGETLRHRSHLGRRSADHLGARDRRAVVAHLALGRRQLLDDGRDRPVRSVYRDLLRYRRRPRVGPDDDGPNKGNRFVEFWNVVFQQYNRGPRRRAERSAAEGDRHRDGVRAHPGAGQRSRLDVRDRSLHRRDRRAAERRHDHARPRRATHPPAHHRRPRARRDVPHRRRRVPLEHRPRVRPALSDPARDPAGAAARVSA